MAELAKINGYDIRDKKLADEGTVTNAGSTDYVLLEDTNGNYQKISKSNFTEAIRNTLGEILMTNDKGTSITSVPVISGDGTSLDPYDLGSATTENLASVLGGGTYTKQQQDGKFIVIKDLNTAPTESTLTYTENGTVKNFKTGDEIRVPDVEADNGYTFYKLYALTTEGSVTTATWDKLGAGDVPVNPNEIVNISLTQVNGDSADLIGAAVTITDDDSGDTLLTTTWNGSTITTEIDVNTNYTVSVDTIEGYKTCPDQSYQAGY